MRAKNSIFCPALLLVSVAALFFTSTGVATNNPDAKRAIRDFLTVRRTTGAEYHDRLEAARRLGRNDSASKWISLLISSDDILSGYDEIVEYRNARKKAFDPIEAGVLVVLMRSLEPPLDPAVAFALTDRLDDAREGRVSGIENIPGGQARIIDGDTPPVREVVKNVLEDAYNATHKFDAKGWRKEIIRSVSDQ